MTILTQHKEKYHPFNFGCSFCVNRFASLDDLNIHVKSFHHFECDLCLAFFVEKALLTKHKEKYHPVVFGCNYCINRFESLDELNIHVATVHSFKCDLCPSHFVKLDLLTEHKEKFNPVIFGCNFCIKHFESLDESNIHVATVHSFKCDLCPSQFVELVLLTQHKEKYHPAIFGCDYCVNRFASPDELNNHFTSVHCFECDLCPSQFVELVLLAQHKEKYESKFFYIFLF